jgi:hypothetical protein
MFAWTATAFPGMTLLSGPFMTAMKRSVVGSGPTLHASRSVLRNNERMVGLGVWRGED